MEKSNSFEINEEKVHVMSKLPKTWILDIDGTLAKHNGYKQDGYDTFLLGKKNFLEMISENDMIIIITARSSSEKERTEKFLKENKIRFDYVIYNAPFGERILINDRKPSGLQMAYAINTVRDIACPDKFIFDETK